MSIVQLSATFHLRRQPAFTPIVLAPKPVRDARLRVVDAGLKLLTGGRYTLARTAGLELFEHALRVNRWDEELARQAEAADFRALVGIAGAAELADYMEQEIMEHTFRNTAIFTPPANVYVALNTTDPTDANSGTEVTGGSYAREAVDTTSGWAAPGATGGSTNNVGAVTFTTATANWGTVSHTKLMDAVTVGNMYFHTPVDTSKAVNNGDTAEFAATTLVATVA